MNKKQKQAWMQQQEQQQMVAPQFLSPNSYNMLVPNTGMYYSQFPPMSPQQAMAPYPPPPLWPQGQPRTGNAPNNNTQGGPNPNLYWASKPSVLWCTSCGLGHADANVSKCRLKTCGCTELTKVQPKHPQQPPGKLGPATQPAADKDANQQAGQAAPSGKGKGKNEGGKGKSGSKAVSLPSGDEDKQHSASYQLATDLADVTYPKHLARQLKRLTRFSKRTT